MSSIEASSLDNNAPDSIHTYVVATPANLDTIPTVVAQLPSEENDIEHQNGSPSSVPFVVATVIRGEVDQQQASESQEDEGTSRKWKYRKEDRPLVMLGCILVLMTIVFTLHEVLSSKRAQTEQSTTTFTYFEYPALALAETVPCQKTNTSSRSCQWVQVGSDLVGPTAGDFFGATLRIGASANGSRFSVTAPLYGMDEGLTQVYDIVEHKDSNNAATTYQYAFQQVGKNFVGKYENDALQGIMADDGYHLIMSSVDASLDGQPNTGHFGSFQITPESGQFEIYGNEMYGQSNDNFGAAVVNRDGTIVAISDIQYDSEANNITNAGVVMLFSYVKKSNEWKQLGEPIEGSSTSEYWGRKVALSGDGYIVAIGSRHYDSNKGKVQVYGFDHDTKEWSVFGQAITGRENGEGVGREVELSSDGKALMVTSDFRISNSTGLNETGIVQSFIYNNVTLEWEQLGSSIVSNIDFPSDFGYQLRTSDDGMRLAISEAKYSPSNDLSSAGRVRVYDYVNGRNWMHVDDVIGQRHCDFVGVGFDLSPDGSHLIVGFPNAKAFGDKGPDCAESDGEPEFGIVRLYELQDTTVEG